MVDLANEQEKFATHAPVLDIDASVMVMMPCTAERALTSSAGNV